MKLNSLQDVFLDVVKDLYSAEMQLVKALPKMAKAATTPKLKQGFEQHLEVTRAQAERLEQICAKMGEKPTGKKCVGMEGLIKEGEEVIEEAGDPAATDAALIVAAQKIEHYEIAGYGSAVTFARILGNTQAARLLQRTLDEEKKTDEKLTQVAEKNVNFEANEGAEFSTKTAGSSRTGAATRRGPARGAGSRKAAPSRKSSATRRKSTASASAGNRRSATAKKKTGTKSTGRNKTAARNSSTSRKAAGAAKKSGRKAPSKAAAAKGGRNSRRK